MAYWNRRQWIIAGVASVLTALAIGIPTVLIPNPVFGREIEPVWWNYPVWIVTSVLAGMLLATYVRGSAPTDATTERRTSRFGIAGGALAWFAVGCPVCNKIALLVLGYSGAITWFAPVQPLLGVTALVLTAVALVVRLQGQVECAMPRSRRAAVAARAGS